MRSRTRKKGGGNVIDSTTIGLCLDVCEWSRFRSIKGEINIHMLLNVETQVLSFLLISEIKVNDMDAMVFIPYESGSYYIFDKACNDFERFSGIIFTR